MILRYGNVGCRGKEESVDEKGKDEFSRLDRLMEKGKEIAGRIAHNAATYMLVSATVVFTACGTSHKAESDTEIDADDVVDVQEENDAPDEIPDIVEDDGADVPYDETDAEEEELPPLECPTPTEHIPPDLNDIFESNWADRLSTTGGEIDSDAELHLSMDPAGTYEECPTPDNGGYKLVCNGDVVDVDGQYYLSVGESDFNAVIEPASDIRDMCPTVSTEYPVVVYAGNTPEAIKNATYDFGSGVRVDSIAGFSIDEPAGLFFNVGDGFSYTRYDGSSLSFTTPSTGEYLIYFMRDTSSINLNTRSIDGRGNESTAVFLLNAPLERNSKELYVYSFGPGDKVNNDIDVLFMYTGNTVCARCAGGPTHYEVTIPVAFDAPVTGACGELGLPSDIRAEVTGTNVSPPHIAGTMTVSLRTNVSRINGPSDSPALILSVDYTGPSDIDAMTVRVNANIIVEGVGHVCSGAVPFTASYPTTVYGTDPDASDYSTTCSCTFGG